MKYEVRWLVKIELITKRTKKHRNSRAPTRDLHKCAVNTSRGCLSALPLPVGKRQRQARNFVSAFVYSMNWIPLPTSDFWLCNAPTSLHFVPGDIEGDEGCRLFCRLLKYPRPPKLSSEINAFYEEIGKSERPQASILRLPNR